jgi:hypothetical protein
MERQTWLQLPSGISCQFLFVVSTESISPVMGICRITLVRGFQTGYDAAKEDVLADKARFIQPNLDILVAIGCVNQKGDKSAVFNSIPIIEPTI